MRHIQFNILKPMSAFSENQLNYNHNISTYAHRNQIQYESVKNIDLNKLQTKARCQFQHTGNDLT